MGPVLRAWSLNHPQGVGTCPGHHPQPIARNRVFKIEKLNFYRILAISIFAHAHFDFHGEMKFSHPSSWYQIFATNSGGKH